MSGNFAVAPAPPDQHTPAPSEFSPAESGKAPSTARSATPIAIETTQLTKRYDSTVAVDHLDLRVEQGEIFGFLGPNGAGKTTTMRMLLGLIRPTSGSASILGMNVATDLPAILARTGSMIEEPVGAENIAFNMVGIERYQ